MSACGYRKLQLDRTRYHWLISVTRTCITWADAGAQRCNAWADQGSQHSSSPIAKAWYSVANAICQAFYLLAKLIGLISANIINALWLLITNIIWIACRLILRGKQKQDPIEHVFVVMLENRSFDHMLGFSTIHGIDAITGAPTTIEAPNPTNNWNTDTHGHRYVASPPAPWVMPADPGHEFTDVQEQLCGIDGKYPHINNSGFVTNYSRIDPNHPDDIMQCYAPNQLPILTTLAQEFAVCDHWFSSMPGPTWPNRFFVHAASSGGLDHSPALPSELSSVLYNGYKFDNGTIYDQLDDENIGWTIYHGDAFPQVLAMSGMTAHLLDGHIKDFEDFSKDVNNPHYATSYAFIEPNYGKFTSNFTCGNSQHPTDDVTRGDRLLKTIYETIRNSPHWDSSFLIITYDEHGGFFDHVPPPQTVAPGDSTTDPENNHNNFDFKQLGVRVPAVIVSPLIPKGVIDHTTYDHTSVLATIENIFGIPSLTERDMHAHTLKHLLSLTLPRTDTPTILPEPAHSGIWCEGDPEQIPGTTPLNVLSAQQTPPTAPMSHSTQGFVHVAFLRDLQTSSPQEKADRTSRFLAIKTHGDAMQYMHEVHQKLAPSKS